MGSVGNKTNLGYTLTADTTILNSRAHVLTQKALENALTNLNRKLKQSEFKIQSYYAGEVWQGGAKFKYNIILPKELQKGYAFNGEKYVEYDIYDTQTAYSQKGAKAIIKDFVDSYNKWFEERNK